MRTHLDQPLLLRGKIVHKDGFAADRYVLIRDGIVEAVSRRRPPRSSDALLVETGGNDWIFPGLIDLHTHADKNVLPIWEHNKGFFNNRFQWRGDEDYRREINGVFNAAKTEVSRNVIPAFAEIQALAGGTTTLQETWDLDSAIGDGENPLLCRGTGDCSDFGLNRRNRILSVVDFFRPNKKATKAKLANKYGTDDKIIDLYASSRLEGKLQATLVHLAEGRSGFGNHVGEVDSYSRIEWETLKEHPCMRDPAEVLKSPFGIIHGCAIDAHNREDIAFLRDRGISVIWSPVSNLLLYGDTLEVEPLLREGINVVLGSDWSPSGSKHVWDEAKFARFLFNAAGANISDVQIFQMVTANASRAVGLSSLGNISPGCFADFFILRSPLETDNAMEVFFGTSDRDVYGVFVGGRPLYGDREFLSRFNLQLQSLPSVEGHSVENKAVHLPDHVDVSIEADVGHLEAALKKQGVKRSNLLASSDTPYCRRMAKLKKYAIDYGWSILRQRRRQRKGSEHESINILVPPDAVRVWRGFQKKVPGFDREAFVDKLKSLFIPSVAPFQSPLGLTAYIPAIIPAGVPLGTPDEIAIVFYESQKAYSDGFSTLAGRAYGDLHSTVFEFSEDAFRSTSAWPVLFSNKIDAGQPYHLFSNMADWQNGHVNVLVATRTAKITSEVFHQRLAETVAQVQRERPSGLEAAIFVATDDYLCYWELWDSRDSGVWEEKRRTVGSATTLISEFTEPHVDVAAKAIVASSDLFGSDAGLGDVEAPVAFNVQFSRRCDIERLT